MKWTGGGKCYKGDTDMHEMKIGIYTDVQAAHQYGSRVQSRIEGALNQASFVYEMQMNIKLKIGDMRMNVAEFGHCRYRLPQMNHLVYTRKVPRMAVSHVISGCWQACPGAGRAYLGTVCTWSGWKRGHNTGVEKINTICGSSSHMKSGTTLVPIILSRMVNTRLVVSWTMAMDSSTTTTSSTPNIGRKRSAAISTVMWIIALVTFKKRAAAAAQPIEQLPLPLP